MIVYPCLRREAHFYCVLQFQLGSQVRNIGVLLYDAQARRVHLRCIEDYSFIVDQDEAEVLAEVTSGLVEQIVQERNPLQLIEHFETTLSNALLISERVFWMLK